MTRAAHRTTSDGSSARSRLPVPVDARRLAARLAVEERELLRELAALEARIRRFADVEQPAYESWRRLAFGPLLATLQEVSDELRVRSVLARRIDELVERDGFHPREALFLVEHPEAWPTRSPFGGFDPDEVEARRRARRERKRAERREQKRARRASAAPAETARDAAAGARSHATPGRIVGLYRALARRIHPDSPHALRSLAPDRLGALWHDVQDAYESRSLERLIAISAWLDSLGADDGDVAPSATTAGAMRAASSTRAPDALLSLAERHERLRALRRACRARERELATLQGDPAWDFERRRSEAAPELTRRTRATIDDEIERLRRALREVEDAIAAIGSPRRPRELRRTSHRGAPG